jgi:hypothetical protein
MKKKALTFALLSAFAITPICVSPLLGSPVAQDRDQDRERDQNRDRDRDDSAYRNNAYYKEGWKDGEHRKHKDHKWKSDEDRRAYEAGYAHGNRGEKWQDRDSDHDHQ